jgi:hypothetical protein
MTQAPSQPPTPAAPPPSEKGAEKSWKCMLIEPPVSPAGGFFFYPQYNFVFVTK